MEPADGELGAILMAWDTSDAVDQEGKAQIVWLREFLRGLTHELSGPLTPLAGHLELLASGVLSGLSPLQRRCLKALQRSVARLRRFNDGIVEVARLERGAFDLNLGEIHLSEMVREVWGDLEDRHSPKDVTLSLNSQQSRGFVVWQDRWMMSRAVFHLLDNAIQFSPEGETVEVSLSNGDDDEKGKGVIRLTVADRGPGVPPEFMDAIFKPFIRLTGVQPSTGDGPGLGLCVVSFIVQAIGGTVKAKRRRNEAGGGMAFTLEIPAGSAP